MVDQKDTQNQDNQQDLVQDQVVKDSEVDVPENEIELPAGDEVTDEEVKDKSSRYDFNVGDTISVHYKITEGSKSRVQPFEGIVIAKKGSEMSKTFTVRRISVGNVGVERIFPLFSPNIENIVVKTKGKVRRAKLYYLREKVGKAATKVKSAVVQ